MSPIADERSRSRRRTTRRRLPPRDAGPHPDDARALRLSWWRFMTFQQDEASARAPQIPGQGGRQIRWFPGINGEPIQRHLGLGIIHMWYFAPARYFYDHQGD